jgi:hypothetical protein
MPDTPALPVEVAPVLSADQSASPPSLARIAFAFGDAESVLDRRELFDLFEVAHNGRWYEPPIPHAGLGRCYRMAAHHQSAILLKRNLLVSSFVPSRWLSKADFARWALDWLIFGNAYLEVVPNLAGRAAALRPAPAAFTRVGLKPGQFFFVPGMYLHDAVEFRTGSIHHLVEPDPMQEIYGMPEYLRRCNRACSTRAPPCSAANTTSTAATRATSSTSATKTSPNGTARPCARRCAAARGRATSATSSSTSRAASPMA